MILGCGLILAMASCRYPDNEITQPITARIVTSDNGVYRLQDVTFESLEDLEQVSGRVGALEGGAALNLASDIGEIIKSDSPEQIYQKRGEAVELDYYIRDGVVYPKNFKSMEMLGLYYVYEKTVAYWQDTMNVSLDDLGYPSLYYNPSLKSSEDGQTTEVTLALNAAYLSGVKDFWFFQTSELEKVPVKMNFGVIAHEFGHFIFDRYFADFDPGAYDSSSPINRDELSGINEGLADFFSYLVTGSVNEYSASLAELGRYRTLPVSWTLATLDESGCVGGFYCKGSILASALYEISQTATGGKVRVANLILEALPLFYQDWVAYQDRFEFGYHLFINRFLEVSSAAERDGFCTIFGTWFDLSSFTGKLTCDNL
jgi:hypothetical protein